ncbi:MAG: O-antigen ligase family protein [Chlorobi bacterium]|nr:O-antigen ligase family protein [Chlorobiota bacterium]
MKKIDPFWNCWHTRHLKILFFSFALLNAINTIAIWLSSLFWFAYLLFDRDKAIGVLKQAYRQHRVPFWASIVLFGLIIIGGLNSSNLILSFEDIIQKLPFVIFPIVLSPLLVLKHEQIEEIKTAFISGTLIMLLLAEGILIYQWFHSTQSVWEFFLSRTYVEFSSLINMHPNLLAFMLTIAISFAIERIVIGQNRFGNGVILALLLLGLWQSASRLTIVFLISIIVGMIFLIMKTWKIRLITTMTIATVSIILLALFLHNNAVRFRLLNLFKGDEVRIKVWTCAIETIKNNPEIVLLGVGTTDVKPTLQRCYQEKGYDLAVRENLNAHNQFLEFLLGGGIFLFFAWLIMLAYFAININSGTMLTFLIAVLGFALVDSILNVQKGIVLFVGFYWFFLYTKNRDGKPN